MLVWLSVLLQIKPSDLELAQLAVWANDAVLLANLGDSVDGQGVVTRSDLSDLLSTVL